MECAEVYSLDREVCIEVYAFAAPALISTVSIVNKFLLSSLRKRNSLIRVTGVAWLVEESFVSNSNKMVRVYRLDVGRGIRNPVGNSCGGTCPSCSPLMGPDPLERRLYDIGI